MKFPALQFYSRCVRETGVGVCKSELTDGDKAQSGEPGVVLMLPQSSNHHHHRRHLPAPAAQIALIITILYTSGSMMSTKYQL